MCVYIFTHYLSTHRSSLVSEQTFNSWPAEYFMRSHCSQHVMLEFKAVLVVVSFLLFSLLALEFFFVFVPSLFVQRAVKAGYSHFSWPILLNVLCF